MHKIIGQTLEKTAIRLSNEFKYKMWELELLTVAISRVYYLRDNFIVGTKEEAKAALLVLLQIKNPNADKISKRLNVLDLLNPNNNKRRENNILARDIYLTMIDVTYTLLSFGFIYLLISRKHPYKTYFGEITKRLE